MVAQGGSFWSMVSDAKNVPFSLIETPVAPDNFFTSAEAPLKGGKFFCARAEFPLPRLNSRGGKLPRYEHAAAQSGRPACF